MKPCEVAIRTTAAVLLGLSTLAPAPGAQADREITKLVPPDGADDDRFGWSVAIDGDLALVGAPYDGDLGPDSGSVYVYVRHFGGPLDGSPFGPDWRLLKKLTAAGGEEGDGFGASVALDDGIAVVGMPGAKVGSYANVGAVLILARNAGGLNEWGEIQRLESPAKLLFAQFGYSIALDGDLLVAGAPSMYTVDNGSAFVYERSTGPGGTWELRAELIPSDPLPGYQPWWFGRHSDIDGNTVVVSATEEWPHNYSGSVHVFDRHQGGTDAWGEVTVLVPPYGYWYMGLFGECASISGDDVVVSEYWYWDDTTATSGAAHVFSRDQGGADEWGLSQTIVHEDAWSVAIDGDLLLVASEAMYSQRTGVIRAYCRGLPGADGWTQVAQLEASDPAVDSGLGWSLALQGDDFIAGAAFADQEAAHVFDFTPAGSAAAMFRNDAGGVNPASYSCDLPAIGGSFEAVVDLTTTGHAYAMLFGFDGAIEVPLAGGQVLLCVDLGGNGQLLPLTAVAGPQAAFQFGIPDDPRLFGATLSTQALHFGGVLPFALSNAQDLVVGYE